MASAHQHHRYALPPPNQSDFRLPSLKDLNFTYQSPTGQPDQQQQQDHQQQQRQHPAWSRAPPAQQQPAPAPHQQHTPPLSAGHDLAAKVDYSKHENGGYAHPGIPLSAQATPVPGTVNIGPPRSEDIAPSPSQPKRSRNASANMGAPRDVRASHPAYPPPHYASYPPSQPTQPAAQYHQIPSGMSAPPSQAPQPAPAPAPVPPPPPAHEQMQHHPVPVSAHPGYAPYQYMQRQPVVHQHPAHQPQQNHSNPYPSPGPPPSAPPPQGPWGQTHPQPQHPPQPPPQQQHQQQQPPPQPQPPPPQHVQHYQQQPPTAQIPSNQPPPPHMIQQHHQQQPPPPPTPQQHPQQQPQQQPPPQQQHPQHYQQQPQQQPLSFPSRTTAIVPTNLETRPATYHEPERVPSARNDPMAEITNHCTVLYSFASRYAQLQGSMPGVQPSGPELEEMSQRAVAVVRLLEELRRMQLPEGERGAPAVAGAVPGGGDAMQQSPDDHRPPKRPWEDISQEEGAAGMQAGGAVEVNGFPEQYTPNGDASAVPQTTAEQDMELIRTKRATSTAVAAGSAGQPKSKYRKRSRATPPGKCHSCNIRETPEWRRGPDGARTLCNACGLHYAKLMRKRDKANANGEAPNIDLETLRASARAADIAEKASRAKQGSRANGTSNAQAQGGGDGDSSMADGVKPVPPTGQQHSFQLVNMMAPMPQEQQAVGGSASVGVMDVGLGGAVNGSMSNRGGGQQQSQQQQQQQQPPPQPPQQQPQQQSQPPPQQQQQQHQPMHSHPPPVTALAPPPPWSRGYTQPEHMQHQSFMRGSATQPR